MTDTTPAPLCKKAKPDRKLQLLGTVQLVVALIGFVGIGAIAGSYWSVGYYERQLSVMRDENRREVEYISRMLEALVYQSADNAGRTAKNAVAVQEATRNAEEALNRANKILDGSPRTPRPKATKPRPATPEPDEQEPALPSITWFPFPWSGDAPHGGEK